MAALALAPVLVSKSMAGPGGLLVTASPSETSNVEITGENLRVTMRTKSVHLAAGSKLVKIFTHHAS